MLAVLSLILLAGAEPVAATATTCAPALRRELLALEKITPRDRARPVLALLPRACPDLPASLLDAARRAARARRDQRIAILGGAAAELGDRACRPTEVKRPASMLAERCPLPPPMMATRELLEDLDQGTYAFGLVVMSLLERAGVPREVGSSFFDNLALATALEAHARRR